MIKYRNYQNYCNTPPPYDIYNDSILEAVKEGSENVVQWWLEAIQKEGSKCKKAKYKIRTNKCFRESFNSNC